VDIAPYENGIQWNNDKLWKKLAREVFKSVQILQLNGTIKSNFRWGGFWTGLEDKPHWEVR
jgi:hypothetical protein